TTPKDTSNFIYHIVQKGETAYGITKKYNITTDYFFKLNPDAKSGLKIEQSVKVGEKIISEPISSKIYSTTIIPAKDTISPIKIDLPKKSTYNIALALPFNLAQSETINPTELAKANMNFPQLSSIALDYYTGFKYALDSLKSSDFNVNLKLYDLSDNDSLKLELMMAEMDKNEMDFIFGPLYASSFKTISEKAKEKSIPVVSPITQQNKFLFENVFASKTNPSNYTLLESLAKYLVDSLVNQQTTVVLYLSNPNDKRELGYNKAFQSYYLNELEVKGKAGKDSLRHCKDFKTFKTIYKNTDNMVVINLSTNQVLITDFTTQLAIFSNKKNVTLCGWKAVSEIENLDQEYLNQLKYTFPSATDFATESQLASSLNYYKSKLNTFPSEYYLMSCDISLYYLSNLKSYGPNFIFRLNELPYTGNTQKFKFTRPDNATGFDNIGSYIICYDQYKLRRTGWH
ncbi:MAG: hypothetical protein AB7O73_13700, partial [Bacteroidia bacterium]